MLPVARGFCYPGTMRTARRQTYLTPEMYLAHERDAEIRHEYVNGEVFAMVGASWAHARIVLNIGSKLNSALRPPCLAAVSDMKVRVEAANAFYYPDVVVTCTADQPDAYVARDPVLVVEVLSPSSERTDQREKRPNYQTIASVQEILLVAQDRRTVELFRRDREGWTVEQVTDEGVIELASVGVTLSMEEIYRNVG
jgi:Uma2 family endonuclease